MAFLKRWGPKLLLLVVLVIVGKYLLGWVHDWLDMSVLPHTENFVHRAIIVAISVYTVLLAIPFIPGAEIGLTLLTVLGSSLAPLVYYGNGDGSYDCILSRAPDTRTRLVHQFDQFGPAQGRRIRSRRPQN